MALDKQMEEQGHWLFKHRGVLPLIIFLGATIIYILNESNPQYWVIEGTSYEIPYELFCLTIALFGFAIRVYTVGYSSPQTSGRNTERQVAEVLNTTGIYSVMRNPLYVGNFFMWLGIAMLAGSIWFVIVFILIYFLYYERIIYTEEKFLTRKFGDSYRRWAAKTPVIIPDLRTYSRNTNKFNLKKVLRQEKNGLTALFIVFCFFDVVGELVKPVPEYNYPLLLAGAGSILVYLVLKFLKYRTSLLNCE